MKQTLALFLILCSLTAHSQVHTTVRKKRSEYRVNLTFTPQLYLNNINVENDGVVPETISTKNTGGFTTGIEIERKSKSGFLLNFGLQYGLRHQYISMGAESLSFFEPGIAKELEDFGPQKEQYTTNSSYMKLRFMTSYVIPYKILHGCQFEFKVGFSASTDLSWFGDEYYRGIVLKQGNTIYVSEIGSGYVNLGYKDPFQSWRKQGEGYIGLRKEVNTKYVRDIHIGLEFTRAIFFSKQADNYNAYLDSYTFQGGTIPVSTDKYIPKDFSIGLRLCAGLWHK